MRFYFLLLLLIFIPLFIVRYYSTQPKIKVGDRVKITATLSSQPYLSTYQQVINISEIRVIAPRFPEFHYGDKITIIDSVTQNDRGLEMANPQITLLAEGGWLPQIRQKMINLFRTTLSERESGLMAGMVVGAKSDINGDFFNSLKNAGLLHVVVASGMNVTLVTKLLMGILLIWLNRKLAIPLALAGVWVYVGLVGLQPPIIRAAIMGSLTFTAQETGRINLSWLALLFSAALMLLIWPPWIRDVGFLLSFGATAGILALDSPIKNFLNGKAKRWPGFIKQDLSTSLAAQVGTTPIILFAFGQFTPWSPFVNAALLWTVVPITTLGFLGGFIGLLIEPVGKFLILLAYPLTWIFTNIVSLF